MQIYTKKLCQRYVAQIQKTLAKCCNVLYEGVKKKLLSGVLNSFYYLSRVGIVPLASSLHQTSKQGVV